MKILIVPDKFKGTLTAREAAEAIAAGWRSIRPLDEIELLPMSDGGDGFGEVMADLLNASAIEVSTINADHDPIRAKWWWQAESKMAIIESARVIGLANLPPGKYHPFQLDTFGLGALFESAKKYGAERCICGIGGSATNDAGFGLARSVRYRFMGDDGEEILSWVELRRLKRIARPSNPLRFGNLQIAVDVQNPLLGPEGATRIYGPQKGLRLEDFVVAEENFQRLVEVVKQDLSRNCADEPGAGAAGGLGYGLRVFLDGHFESGFSIFAKEANLKNRITSADLVITAEGAIDSQSLMGKGTGAVAQLCKRENVRCIGLAGVVESAALTQLATLFSQIHAIVPEHAPLEQAKAQPGYWLERLAEFAARSFASKSY
jgi:glycerate kinase